MPSLTRLVVVEVESHRMTEQTGREGVERGIVDRAKDVMGSAPTTSVEIHNRVGMRGVVIH